MPRRYTVEVEIHRTVSVTPKNSVSLGGLVLLFLFLFGVGVAAIALTAENAKHKSTAQDFHNPLGNAPSDDNPYGSAPDDYAEPIPDVSPEPEAPVKEAGQRLVIKADGDNQCQIAASANGVPFLMLADTGAGGLFFTIRDARWLGFDPAKLTYDHTYSQWGGKVKGAHVRLKEFRVGKFALKDVEAVIDQTDWQHPLLGAPILKAMNFQMRRGECVLTLPQTAASTLAYKPGDRADMNRLIENAR
jgi:clan AA aspartic protease (TIGR02281 family)